MRLLVGIWLLVVLVSLGCGPAAARLDFLLPSTARRPDRPLRLRIHVSGTYASQEIGTHAHLRGIVRDADAILFSSTGAHLVIEEIVDGWKVEVGRSSSALAALMDSDPGEDVDVVVGMLGGSSERQDHYGGMAEQGGRHMVVRSEDTDVAGEHAFAVVAFLHELGHVLGAPHDTGPDSIMNASGGSRWASFSNDAVQIIRSGLARRGILASTMLRPGRARAQREDTSTKLTSADQVTLQQALDAERRGDVMTAWQTASPLFAAYPSELAVQDLRCRLARSRDLPWSEVRAECDALMLLMTPGMNPLE